MSTATLNTTTVKIIDEVKQWQQRPLDSHYPFIWLDAIHYKIRENRCSLTKAIYTVLALNIESNKEVLGLYIAESEGANFWQSLFSDLNYRGVADILIASVDGLTGFPKVINTIFRRPRSSCASSTKSEIHCAILIIFTIGVFR